MAIHKFILSCSECVLTLSEKGVLWMLFTVTGLWRLWRVGGYSAVRHFVGVLTRWKRDSDAWDEHWWK